MFSKLKRFLGIQEPLSKSIKDCPKCGDPSFYGVCPSCFQRGEAKWQETTKD